MMSELGLGVVEEDWLRTMDEGIGNGVWRSGFAQGLQIWELEKATRPS